MRNVFIVEEIKFIYMVLEETFAQAGIDTYVHTEKGNFAYFIDDITPDILLVSLDMIKDDIPAFNEELSKANHNVKVIAYGDSDQLLGLEDNFFAILSKPLDQAKLLSQITQLMTQN